MKSLVFLIVILSILVLVNYSEAQAPIASIGTFMARSRERKRLSALREGHHSGFITKREANLDCDGFNSYLEPCRSSKSDDLRI